MNGQPQDGPEVQLKLGKVLGDHGHHPGVVRPWRQLGEDDFFPADEEFDAEQSRPVGTGQTIRHFLCHALSLLEDGCFHGMWDP